MGYGVVCLVEIAVETTKRSKEWRGIFGCRNCCTEKMVQNTQEASETVWNDFTFFSFILNSLTYLLHSLLTVISLLITSFASIALSLPLCP